MVDHDKLRNLLNSLHLMARKAPIFEELEKMMGEAGDGINGLYDLAVWSNRQINLRAFAVTSAPPAPHKAFPPNKTIGHILEEIHENFDFANRCDNPTGMFDFSGSWSGNWELRPDQLTEKQMKAFRFLMMAYRQQCEERGTLPKYLSPGDTL